MDVNEAIQNSQAAEKARAFHLAQTTENPTKEQLKAAGIDHNVERAKEPEGVSSEFVFTNDVADLPKGSSARIVTDGLIEVFKTSDNQPVVTDAPVVDRSDEGKVTEEISKTGSFTPIPLVVDSMLKPFKK